MKVAAHCKWLGIIFFLLASNLILFSLARADVEPDFNRIAISLQVEGAISPATQDYIVRGINLANKEQAKLVILKLDTPGGLSTSMRSIIKAILSSNVPVVTYVFPSGARAASAGTYILYASHIAAMAPGTNLGAATPIQIGGLAPKPTEEKDKKEDKATEKDKEEPPKDAAHAKAVSDAVAYIRSLAELRNRNAEWAEESVRQAASLSARQALKKNVINVIADNTPQLLQKIDGMQVKVHSQMVTIDSKNLQIDTVEPGWHSRLLAVIADPSVAYILLLIGIYGLFFEFANPGFVVPGVVGGIALLLALYAFQLLPINYAGLALIFLGLIFLTAEAFVPSFGALGIGGIIAFVAGSFLLIDTDMEKYNIDWSLILIMAIINAIFFLGIIGMAIKSKRRKIVSGEEELLHLPAVALEDFSAEGWVQVHSERWKAKSDTPIKKGQKVKVVKVQGLILTVMPDKNNKK